MGMYELNEEKQGRLGRVLLWVLGSLIALIIICVVGCLLLVNTGASIGGYSMIINNSQSSSDVLPTGSLLIVKNEVGYTPNVGDAVIYKNESNTKVIARATGIIATEGEASTIMAISGGEPLEFKSSAIIANIVLYIGTLGAIFNFIMTPMGLICCVAIPLLILLIFEIINLVFLSGKGENEDEAIDEEKPSYMRVTENVQPPIFPPEVTTAPQMSRNLVNPLAEQKKSQSAALTGLDKNIVEAANINLQIDNSQQLENGLKYQKPPVSEPSPEKLIYATREFKISQKNRANQQDSGKQGAPVHIKPPFQNPAMARQAAPPVTQVAPAPQTTPPQQPTQRRTADSFAANLAAPAKSSDNAQNQFLIDGIDVNVKPDSLKLVMDNDDQARDIYITVTNEYTNVTVGSGDKEVNFALFREGGSDDQRVIIRKKSK